MTMVQWFAFLLIAFAWQVDIAAAQLTFNVNPASPSVEENSAIGVTVVTVTVTEAETFTYALESQTPDTPAETFAIVSSSGVVTTKRANIDFEINEEYTIVIKATETGGASRTGTTSVTVMVIDMGPTFPETPFATCINTNSSAGTLVIQVTAKPEDDGDILKYSIEGGDTGVVFSVNASGHIEVATGQVVSKTPDSYSLVLIASDSKTPSETGTTTVSVTVGDPCPRSYATTVMASFYVLLISGVVSAIMF